MRLHLLAVLLTPALLSAQTFRDSVIAVTASRISRAAPDRASFYVVVEGTAETATDAVARVESKMKAVTDALRSQGGRVESERPIAYNVSPTLAPNGYPGVSTPPTNTSRTVIRVTTTRPDQIANVIAAALTAGAASTSGLVFESSAIDSVRRSRTAEVFASARQDAEAMASALGGHLGALVDASIAGNPGFTQQAQINFDNRYGSPSYAPEVSVTTTVTVRYRLLH